MSDQYETRIARLRSLIDRETNLLRMLSEAKSEAAVTHIAASLNWCRQEIRSCNQILAAQGT